MEENIIMGVIGLLTTAGGYIFGARKNKAEAKAMEEVNEKEIFTTYKTEIEYFSKQLELCRKEISELRADLSSLIERQCNRGDCPNRLKA